MRLSVCASYTARSGCLFTTEPCALQLSVRAACAVTCTCCCATGTRGRRAGKAFPRCTGCCAMARRGCCAGMIIPQRHAHAAVLWAQGGGVQRGVFHIAMHGLLRCGYKGAAGRGSFPAAPCTACCATGTRGRQSRGPQNKGAGCFLHVAAGMSRDTHSSFLCTESGCSGVGVGQGALDSILCPPAAGASLGLVGYWSGYGALRAACRRWNGRWHHHYSCGWVHRTLASPLLLSCEFCPWPPL